MAGAAFTQENLDKLEEALVKGIKRVEYLDKEVEYRSVDEMLKIRDLMRRCLGLTLEPCRIFSKTSKGLC